MKFSISKLSRVFSAPIRGESEGTGSIAESRHGAGGDDGRAAPCESGGREAPPFRADLSGVTLYRGARATALRRVTLHPTPSCASRGLEHLRSRIGTPASLGGLERLDVDTRHPEDNRRKALASHGGALRHRVRRDHHRFQSPLLPGNSPPPRSSTTASSRS